MIEFKTEVGEKIDQLNRLYPNRHKEIHLLECKHCPSKRDSDNGREDEESKEIKANYPKEFIAKEFLFVCAWRESKLCKGLCDYMEIDQEFLNNQNL